MAETSCQVPVFYATSEGQTARIARHVADMLCDSGLDSRAIDVASPEAARFDWARVQAVILGASLHIGRHQRTAVKFARRHVDQLNDHPSAFFSVSLGVASRNAADVTLATNHARDFVDAVRWHPRQVVCFAGRLAYSQYGWLTRLIMWRIARREGEPTDPGRDYDLTDWAAVSRFAQDFAAGLRHSPAE